MTVDRFPTDVLSAPLLGGVRGQFYTWLVKAEKTQRLRGEVLLLYTSIFELSWLCELSSQLNTKLFVFRTLLIIALDLIITQLRGVFKFLRRCVIICGWNDSSFLSRSVSVAGTPPHTHTPQISDFHPLPHSLFLIPPPGAINTEIRDSPFLQGRKDRNWEFRNSRL